MFVPRLRGDDIDRDRTISVQINGSAFARLTIAEARDLARALEGVSSKALEAEANVRIENGGSYGDDRRDHRTPPV